MRDSRDLRFIPTGKIYLTPGQKQARYIRMLEHWVVILAILFVILFIAFGIAVVL